MELRPEEARVLAALIEKEAAVPDSYPLTLNALRSACNQSNNRNPVVSYDDRTIDNALMALKSIGLVRFVHPSHGGRTTRYRHIADERWQLEPGELIVLAMLTLRGPSTSNEVAARVERLLPAGSPSVDEAIDTLMARRPEPFAARLERGVGEREPRFASLLAGEVPPADPATTAATTFDDPTARSMTDAAATSVVAPGVGATGDDRVVALEAEVARLRRRLEHLEHALGIDPADAL